jgi:hypothetical protein
MAGPSIAIPGLCLEVSEEEPGRRAPDRLELVAADPRSEPDPDADDPTLTAARFVALGWATVDLERVAATWPVLNWAAVARDSLVGARALLGRPDVAGPGATGPGAWGAGLAPARPPVTTLLLEPDTEGRVAAALARHGEGPAVLYLGLPVAVAAGVRIRLAGPGVRVSSGPTLVIVPSREFDGARGPAPVGRGTIRA